MQKSLKRHLFLDFSKAFDSIHRGKMEQIRLTFELPKETVTAIMILYKNTKVKVHLPDGDTDFFNIVACVLQGDTLAPYLFIICLNYELCTSIYLMKENRFTLKKARSRRYPAQIITDADYADDIANKACRTLLEKQGRTHKWRSPIDPFKWTYQCWSANRNLPTIALYGHGM